MSFVSWIYIIIVQWPYIRIKRDEDVGISSLRSADQTSTSVEEDSNKTQERKRKQNMKQLLFTLTVQYDGILSFVLKPAVCRRCWSLSLLTPAMLRLKL